MSIEFFTLFITAFYKLDVPYIEFIERDVHYAINFEMECRCVGVPGITNINIPLRFLSSPSVLPPLIQFSKW